MTSNSDINLDSNLSLNYNHDSNRDNLNSNPSFYKKLFSKINPSFFFLSFIFPAALITIGFLIIIFLVLIPYTDFKLSAVMLSPIVPTALKNSTGFEDFKFSELSSHVVSKPFIKNVPATFSLSIPKLGIKNAKVETNSLTLDPDKLLGHYRGTALPGDSGNAFIYGHSVLPYFYNPKDYKTIFSTLPSLNKGDLILLDFNGVIYKYEIAAKLTLKPSDVNVFDTNPAHISDTTSFVTLMTCAPPGAKTYRLLVVGRLIK